MKKMMKKKKLDKKYFSLIFLIQIWNLLSIEEEEVTERNQFFSVNSSNSLRLFLKEKSAKMEKIIN